MRIDYYKITMSLWTNLLLRSGIRTQSTSTAKMSSYRWGLQMVEFYAKYHALEYNLRPYLRKRLINQDHTKDRQIISLIRILINTGIGATSYFNGSIRESHLMMNHGTVLLLRP